MIHPPTIPEEISEHTTLREENGKWIIHCTPSGFDTYWAQANFISDLIREEYVEDLISGQLSLDTTTAICEILGNMLQHSRTNNSPKYTDFIIDPITKSCAVITTGYIATEARARLSEKFQAAASLSPAEARHRLAKILDSKEIETLSFGGSEQTGGTGMLTMRAIAHGPMKLTFYPKQTFAGKSYMLGENIELEKFTFEVQLQHPNKQLPDNKVLNQRQVESFLPQIDRSV